MCCINKCRHVLFWNSPTFAPVLEDDAIALPEEEYLYIQKSQIVGAGDGLYTAVEIYKGETICMYTGEKLSFKEANKRAKNGENRYFISLPNQKILDSMHTFCFAKYANDAAGPGKKLFKNNAIISLDDSGNVVLKAKQKIKAGEEIFCAYGKKYWKDKMQ